MERINNQSNLIKLPDFITAQVNSVFHRTKSVLHPRPKIWDIVPEELKHRKSLNGFKNPSKCGYQLILFAGFAEFT